MARVPDIIPVSDLRQDAAAVLRRIRGLRRPLVITQRGRAAAVMLSMEAYERVEHQLRLLRLLAGGEKEIASGEGHSLDSVLSEADEMITGDE
ncbi:MAG: type II toxin-antitoxin system prevent-host-death family antitoxin [Candidatus Eisenbacteria bacterium]|nr:type II toxin-antitoxin system prevent-host-death family antitoxin [Candidatus Eisenbacteria bacterium]